MLCEVCRWEGTDVGIGKQACVRRCILELHVEGGHCWRALSARQPDRLVSESAVRAESLAEKYVCK